MVHPTPYIVPPPQGRETIREWDKRAIEDFKIPGLILMENAGEGFVSIFEQLLLSESSTPLEPPIQIICGPGNNGGDGFVIARHLKNRNYPVQVHLTSAASQIHLTSDAGINLDIVRKMKIPLFEPDSDLDGSINRAINGGTLIDAIFGSGLSREIAPPQKQWIDRMNASGLPTISVDIPSGLDADSGKILGTAVKALHTVTFVAPKLGFTLAQGPACTGQTHVVGISIPRSLLESRSSHEHIEGS